MTEEKKKRGFAAMSKEKQREIARRGGRAAHQKGTAHEFTTSEAMEAGRKGGLAKQQRRTNNSSISLGDSTNESIVH